MLAAKAIFEGLITVLGETVKEEYLDFYFVLIFLCSLLAKGFMISSSLSSLFSLDPCPPPPSLLVDKRLTHLPFPLTYKPHDKKSKSHRKQQRETHSPPLPSSLLSTFVTAQIFQTFRVNENNFLCIYSPIKMDLANHT